MKNIHHATTIHCSLIINHSLFCSFAHKAETMSGFAEPFKISVVYIPTAMDPNKRKHGEDNHSHSSEKSNKDGSGTATTSGSTSTDGVEVLPSQMERLSKLEKDFDAVKKELVEVKKELKEVKHTIISDFREFWTTQKKNTEDWIHTKLILLKDKVYQTEDNLTKRWLETERKVSEVWSKEEARTERLDELIKKEKK